MVKTSLNRKEREERKELKQNLGALCSEILGSVTSWGQYSPPNAKANRETSPRQ